MAVNEPSPRAQPEDEVCLRSHNSLATSQSLIYFTNGGPRYPIRSSSTQPSNECPRVGYASFPLATVENG